MDAEAIRLYKARGATRTSHDCAPKRARINPAFRGTTDLALRRIEGIEAPAPASPVIAPATRKGGMTPAGWRRLSAAMTRRWVVNREYPHKNEP